MGIDSIGAGFNPHLLSDLSAVNAAVSALVLPSAFRPVPDPTTPTGSRWEMDPTLLVSAEVTNDNPFTVTYKIRPEAQWTDNAPIAADDFWYLWRQMVSQPGVVDPPATTSSPVCSQSMAASKPSSRSRSHIRHGGNCSATSCPRTSSKTSRAASRRAGARPAGHGRTVPGGDHRPAARRDFDRPQRPVLGSAGEAGSYPFPSGGRAGRAGRLDPQRRHPGRPGAWRIGGLRPAVGHPGRANRAHHDPRVMQLTLRANVPKLADSQVRKAILGLLDVDLLAAVGAGSDNTVTLDQAQIRAPSDPGYVPTAPRR
ncbi:bacterial extracellular solute-binding s, 5 Middle family protein [Mycobacterium xenopi 4042]|uniref:Bacterial extracellular solute-binding s, 5 Middle family protein n=1 Tax=Mycobacterium xenopi 4042 TaxID=1299334 RepID=X8DZ21_MYCXE|nr:bacterial extracellular solute-binding s, 5 Middle family protein [Mycobacterium xenopi 4042]